MLENGHAFSPAAKEKKRQFFLLPLLGAFFGLFSLLLVFATYKIVTKGYQNYLLTDTLHEIQSDLTRAHLWIEEIETKDPAYDIKDAWAAIGHALTFTDAMRKGGPSIHGYRLRPVDPLLQNNVEHLRAMILRYRELAEKSIQEGRLSQADRAFDQHYREIIFYVVQLDREFALLQTRYDQQSGGLLITILVVWSFVVFASSGGLFHYERQKRRMNELILRAKKEWEQTFDIIPDLVALIDREHRLVRANRSLLDAMGLNAQEIIGKVCSEIPHPPERSLPVYSCHTLPASEACTSAEVYEPGSGVHYLVTVLPFCDDRGNVLGSVHMARDITGLKKVEKELKIYQDQLEQLVGKRTEDLAAAVASLNSEVSRHRDTAEALRGSEHQFRQLSQEFNILLDAIPDSLVLLSPDLRVKWANREAMKTMKQARTAPSEQYCYTLWHDTDSPCSECPVLKSFQTGNPETIQMKAPDGRLWASRAYPIRDEQGVVISVMEINTDITEKVLLQAERMRASHLASIGELAAGVAHEINNPINGIINYAQILLNSPVADSNGYDIAKRIMKEGERIAVIVRSLLSFARERREEKVPVQLDRVIMDSLSLIEMQMKKSGVEIRIVLPVDLPPVAAHAQQLQQVFLNLINNARYALNIKYPYADPNKVFIITGEKVAREGQSFVRVIFEDHGSGMSEKVRNNVMTPFFTTKPVGIGTGLGLSISHGIITDHGGWIEIESREGEYTKVIVYLPVQESGA